MIFLASCLFFFFFFAVIHDHKWLFILYRSTWSDTVCVWTLLTQFGGFLGRNLHWTKWSDKVFAIEISWKLPSWPCAVAVKPWERITSCSKPVPTIIEGLKFYHPLHTYSQDLRVRTIQMVQLGPRLGLEWTHTAIHARSRRHILVQVTTCWSLLRVQQNIARTVRGMMVWCLYACYVRLIWVCTTLDIGLLRLQLLKNNQLIVTKLTHINVYHSVHHWKIPLPETLDQS